MFFPKKGCEGPKRALRQSRAVRVYEFASAQARRIRSGAGDLGTGFFREREDDRDYLMVAE